MLRDRNRAAGYGEEGEVALIPCPYLQTDVELSAEREGHIRERHPDLLPLFRDRLIQTLYDPDEVRSSARLQRFRIRTFLPHLTL